MQHTSHGEQGSLTLPHSRGAILLVYLQHLAVSTDTFQKLPDKILTKYTLNKRDTYSRDEDRSSSTEEASSGDPAAASRFELLRHGNPITFF